LLTLAWLVGMTYFLCHTLSGRAAYIHIGGMMGTWMTANVFMRIIPRQIKMVEAAKNGEAVNQDWGKNAKNRSTHNTYLTLPVIFVMLSNHFPQTYGHEYNWLILLLISVAGAAIREYFVVRLKNPNRSLIAATAGIAIIVAVVVFSGEPSEDVASASAESSHSHTEEAKTPAATTTPAPTPAPEAAPVAAPVNEAAGTGKPVTVTGSVYFEGTPPENKKLSLPAACAKNFKGEPYSNEVIVKDGKIQNVLIRVVSGLEGKTFSDVPAEEVELDQKGCLYTPRVVGARVGQKVTFINSDPVFHNVRAVTKLNQKFNMAMPHKDQRITKVFSKPEVFLQAKCSVHPWMGAYVAIMEHPFFSVSNAKGEFSIKDLPAGKYTVEAWHEVFGTQTQEINVTESGMTPLKFTFK
ncbi:MAG: urate hydroxylase PuuD, partial [Bdellovibrionales bacterium]|nr:urate hydroxylase PuuD [Bdellovibrionales bacterium]